MMRNQFQYRTKGLHINIWKIYLVYAPPKDAKPWNERLLVFGKTNLDSTKKLWQIRRGKGKQQDKNEKNNGKCYKDGAF